jgi:peroxiredoxin
MSAMAEFVSRHRPVDIGATAPDFTLIMVETGQPVSLHDYRGKSSLLLGLYRGVFCAFCRRAVARLGRIGDRLRPFGVETLAVIGTTLDNTRLYYRHHPTRMAIAVDPDLAIHRAYGLPKVEAPWEIVSTLPRNPDGELPEALPLWEATKALGRRDGFKPTETDREDGRRSWNQSIGEFLIDRHGLVRWRHTEGATAADYMVTFSSEEELLSAARSLAP